MTKELYEKVKDEIPKHIGVYVEGYCSKRAKKQKLTVDEQILKDSMIRSLYREVDKSIRSNTPHVVAALNRNIRRVEKERDDARRSYRELMEIGRQKYGRGWDH
jgi:hypothetical protein